MPPSFASVSGIIACALLSYLAGSVPFGLILTKAKGHGDIRALGSGNIGATNVLRTGDKRLAFATLLCDVLKGFVPVLIAAHFGPEAAATAVIFAPLGHMFPVWLGFKGGKGVATTFGALIAYAWPVAAAVLATWLVVAILFRYSSLAALIATALAPVYAWYFSATPAPPLVVLFIALLVILRHHRNIARLSRGEESKIELKRKPR
jgi:acyl phosphate:glycerol-3-phosphate acyltransferase